MMGVIGLVILFIVNDYQRVGTSLLCFYFYPLCYAVVLLKFTYYAQYYAQEQEILPGYCAINIQFCMNSSLYVADNL